VNAQGPAAHAAAGEQQRAVFLSYASEDSEVAGRLCESLRAAGIEVWYDKSALRGGDAWDAAIRRQIKACVLFVPVISRHTQARAEGYFRLEWKLAVDRSHLMAQDKAFLVPVVVDDTGEAEARVPDRFREVQWTALPDGRTTPAFVSRVSQLVALRPSATTMADPSAAILAAGTTIRSQRLPLLWLAATAMIVAALWALDHFVLAKRPMPAAAAAAAPAIPMAAPAGVTDLIPEKSIAVLPFADLSEKHDQEYFSDGLSEELINQLARVADLHVPGRTSSFYFKGKSEDIATIAHKLHVAHVLEGSVRRSGHVVRISAQLIQADSGYDMWSQTYDQNVKDIFQVQDQIAAAVVEALKVKLLQARAQAPGSRTQTASSEAHDAYLLGRQALERDNSDGYRQAVGEFRRAMALDPGYAAASAGLAEAEIQLADTTSGERGALQRAREAADRAIALAPDASEGYTARAFLRSDFLWDWNGARSDIERAVAIDPNNSRIQVRYADLLGDLGQLSEAVAAARKAVDLDPLSEPSWVALGYALRDDGQFAAARAAILRAQEINPDSLHAIHRLAVTELLDGHPEQALAIAARGSYQQLDTALAAYTLGQREESQRALDYLIKNRADTLAFQIAEIYAWRGELDPAFKWLDQAYAQHDGGLATIKEDRLLAKLRGDPRYTALLEKMGLPH
jgi:TolB-like protein